MGGGTVWNRGPQLRSLSDSNIDEKSMNILHQIAYTCGESSAASIVCVALFSISLIIYSHYTPYMMLHSNLKHPAI